MTDQTNQNAPELHGLLGPREVLRRLHLQCHSVVDLSLSERNEACIGESYLFANDLDSWCKAISGYAESSLVATASSEYVLAMLNVCQGQYRNGFKGLRLVLELCMQSIHLSADLVLREEWIKGEKDTIWAVLVDHQDGPLSMRFCRAFFAELSEHTSHYRELAKTLYRELSECIHGNTPNHIPLPSSLEFSQDTFELWHAKAASVRLVIHFAFTLRYLRSLPKPNRLEIEPVLIEQLGHIAAIRTECTVDA